MGRQIVSKTESFSTFFRFQWSELTQYPLIEVRARNKNGASKKQRSWDEDDKDSPPKIHQSLLVPDNRSEEEQERELDGKDSRCQKEGSATLQFHTAKELLDDVRRRNLKSRLDVHLEVYQWNIDVGHHRPGDERNTGQEEEHVVG